VVLAIRAIPETLLLPALGKAKQKGPAASCGNDLHRDANNCRPLGQTAGLCSPWAAEGSRFGSSSRADSYTTQQFSFWSYADHYSILGLLPDPEGGVSDIAGLFLAKLNLLPVGQRIFIRTVQPINGWRDLPKTISARIPAQ
jgi:hypothetical protein